MEREMFDFAVTWMGCTKGGTKEACLIIREYLKSVESGSKSISSPRSAVTPDEFIAAVKVLMAYSYQGGSIDVVPELWKCDSDCSNSSCTFCPGEFQLTGKDDEGKHLSKKLCPYFCDSGDI